MAYKILKRVSIVPYELELQEDLVAVHTVFYILLLKKFVGYPPYIIPLEYVSMKDNITYEDALVEILDRVV